MHSRIKALLFPDSPKPRGSLQPIRQSLVIITRKSTTSSSLRESKTYVDPTLIPNMLPDHKEAWNAFVSNSKTPYKTILESYRANEVDLKPLYSDYLRESRKLKFLREIVDKRKNELLDAKMFQQYVSRDDDMTDSERVSQENLDKAQEKLLEQQEEVLKLQSQLRLHLDNRRDLKQQMQEDFDWFCRENYNILVPEIYADEESLLKSETMEIDIDEDDDDEEEQRKCTETLVDTLKLEKLKKLMAREIRKNMRLKAIKDRKWKNLY